MTDTKLYVPVAAFSTQENIKLLEELESGFKEPLIGIDIYPKQQVKHERDI